MAGQGPPGRSGPQRAHRPLLRPQLKGWPRGTAPPGPLDPAQREEAPAIADRSVKRLLERAPLPEGAVAVTAGVIVAGIAAYGFLVLSGRALGPKLYADLSVLWVLGFIVGPGAFMPLEQEISRAIAARRARGMGAQPVLRRAIVLGAGMLAIFVVAATAAGAPITSKLFDHHLALFIGFLVSLASLYVGYLARGYLSGNGRFGAYGVLVGAEGVFRLLPVLFFAGVGWATVGPYGLAFAIAPLISAPLVLSRQRRLLTPGPQAPWGELTAALGYLVAASLLAQLLLNLAVLTIKVLSSPAQQPLAGRFLAGLVIARVPVVLFQAVLAALLPKLASLAAKGEFKEFARTTWGLLATVVVLGVVAVATAVVAGTFALTVLFGKQYHLQRVDFAYLSGASIVYIVALTLGQALVALRAYAALVVGWVAGVLGFLVAVSLVQTLLLRVELGFLAGSAASAVVLGVLLLRRLASREPSPPGRFAPEQVSAPGAA